MSAQASSNDVGSFLAVFAALLLDNALRLDETVGRVTDLVLGTHRPDRELVVALQGFDRLKQEFEAIGDALTLYAASTNAVPQSGQERAQLERDVVASIALDELKGRLLRGLQNEPSKMVPSSGTQSPSDELEVDVVF